ncbi:MAG: CarD family transcriptional regulator [Atribacterota bacterium]
MFKIGDKVSHPSFGVGDVKNIEEKKVLGQEEKYYILKLMVNEMTLMVPVNKAEEIGLRYIIDPKTVPEVLNVLRHKMDDEMDGNYKQRIRSQTEMVDSGDILKVAQVVKNYTHRDNVEKLSSTERGLYDRARKILVGEISVACNIEQTKAKFIIKEAVRKGDRKGQTKSH